MPIARFLRARWRGEVFAAMPKNGGISRCETSRFPTPTSIFRCGDGIAWARRHERSQTKIKFLDQIVVVELLGGAALEGNFTVDDHIAAISDADRLIEILFRHQDCEGIALFHFGDRIDGTADEYGSKANGRLVHQKDFRAYHQPAPHRHFLCLAPKKPSAGLGTALGKSGKVS